MATKLKTDFPYPCCRTCEHLERHSQSLVLQCSVLENPEQWVISGWIDSEGCDVRNKRPRNVKIGRLR
jgi:hypothetical protein